MKAQNITLKARVEIEPALLHELNNEHHLTVKPDVVVFLNVETQDGDIVRYKIDKGLLQYYYCGEWCYLCPGPVV